MKRPGYREAIYWLAHNDDSTWAKHDPDTGQGSISVAGALVCDLFDVDHMKLRADLQRELRRTRKEQAELAAECDDMAESEFTGVIP